MRDRLIYSRTRGGDPGTGLAARLTPAERIEVMVAVEGRAFVAELSLDQADDLAWAVLSALREHNRELASDPADAFAPDSVDLAAWLRAIEPAEEERPARADYSGSRGPADPRNRRHGSGAPSTRRTT